MDQRRAVGGERAGEGGGEVGVALHAFAVAAVRDREGREVGIGERGALDVAGERALLVHADRAEHAVVADEHDDARTDLHGGGELVAGHLEAAVTGEGHDGARRIVQRGRDRRGNAIAHCAAGGRELGAEATVAVVAVDPDGVVAGAVGDHRVVGQRLAQVPDDLAEIHAGELARGGLAPRLVIAAQRLRPHRARRPAERSTRHKSVDHERRRGGDRQIRVPHPAELRRLGMHVGDQVPEPALLRQPGVAATRDLAEASAEQDDQIGLGHTRLERRIGAEAEVADVRRRGVVDAVLTAELRRHGDGRGHRPVGQRSGGRLTPVRPADDHERLRRVAKPRVEAVEVGRIRVAQHRFRARRVGGSGHLTLHVLRQGEHNGARPVGQRDLEGPPQHLRDLVGGLDLRGPLGERREHRRQIDLLERLAPLMLAPHLPEQEQHRRRVLEGGVHADRRVRRSRPPRGEAHARPTRQLPPRLRHVRGGGFMARGDVANPVASLPEPVEHAEERLARHPEHGVHALRDQLVGDDVAAEARHASRMPAQAMYFSSRKSSMPCCEPSRPMPDSLTPPNGASAALMKPVLMAIIP